LDVVIVLVFVSLVLVTAAVVMFIMRVKGGDLEHGERLSLLPLDDDDRVRPARRADERGDESETMSGGEQ
jgi:hypothetical protein